MYMVARLVLIAIVVGIAYLLTAGRFAKTFPRIGSFWPSWLRQLVLGKDETAPPHNPHSN